MMKHLLRIRGMLSILALLMLVAFASPVMAANGPTWLPDYDSGKRVYVDPTLSNDPSFPVNLNGLEFNIRAAGNKHDVKVFVVATEQGTDLPAGTPKMAADKLDQLVAKWSASSNFPTDDYLIILWVRYDGDPQHGSVAVNSGNRLRDYGISRDYFDDKVNGPVTKNLRKYMPQDPKGAFLAIAESVNTDIQAWKTAEADKQAHDQMMAMMPLYIGLGVLLTVVLGTLLFLALRFRSWKKKLSSLLAQWEPKMAAANEMYIKLSGSYMGFLTEQGDWNKKFAGETLKAYKAAVEDFADFSVRQKKANELLKAARKQLESARFPSIKGLRDGVETLDSRLVTITGDDLPLETASLFGGLVEKTDYKPGELLTSMEELFERTNQALARIVKSFQGARENRQDITRLLAEIAKVKPELEAVGLTFAPYQAELDAIEKGQSAFIEILSSNPLEAYAGSEAVEASTEKLKARLRRAIDIQNALPTVDASLDAAEARASELRGKRAENHYPTASSETPASSETFRLDEEGGNPDPLIERGRKRLEDARRLVFSASLEEAATAKSDAESGANRAVELIDSVLKAKAFVETRVQNARQALLKLREELPAADDAVAELEGSFLKANIQGQPEKLGAAKDIESGADAQLAAIKKSYDGQRFLTSQKQLEDFQRTLDNARTQLQAIHAHLAELRRQRQDARDTVAGCGRSHAELAEHLSQSSFIASRNTDTKFDEARRELQSLESESRQRVADWPALSARAHRLASAIVEVGRQLDVEKRDYEAARKALRTLESNLESAEESTQDNRVRSEARRLAGVANTAYRTVQEDLRTPKSNWSQVKKDAEEGNKAALEAASTAQNDVLLAIAASSAIQSAAQRIEQVAQHRYGYHVTADLDSASRSLGSAKERYRLRQYEDAKSSAEEASRNADSAYNSAVRKAKKKEDEESSTNVGIGVGVGVNLGRGNGNGGVVKRSPNPTPARREPRSSNHETRPSSGGDEVRRSSGGDDY